MIYYNDSTITIRSMEEADSQIIYDEFLNQNSHPNIETYMNYFREQVLNQRYVFVIEYLGEVAGYATLLLNTSTGPFADQGVPEIVDFNVFQEYRKKGIGNKTLDVIEEFVSKISSIISLGVGLHYGYGSAQRIYIKRGYMPDGSGVWYKNKQLEQYSNCCNDDDLILYFSKPLL